MSKKTIRTLSKGKTITTLAIDLEATCFNIEDFKTIIELCSVYEKISLLSVKEQTITFVFSEIAEELAY